MSKIMCASSPDHMSGGDAWHCLLQSVAFEKLIRKVAKSIPGTVFAYKRKLCFQWVFALVGINSLVRLFKLLILAVESSDVLKFPIRRVDSHGVSIRKIRQSWSSFYLWGKSRCGTVSSNKLSYGKFPQKFYKLVANPYRQKLSALSRKLLGHNGEINWS